MFILQIANCKSQVSSIVLDFHVFIITRVFIDYKDIHYSTVGLVGYYCYDKSKDQWIV